MIDKPFSALSQRLMLRAFQPGDAPDLFALNSNEKVMRYTGEQPFSNIKAAEDFINDYQHYADHGFGRWAVIGRESDRFLGFCGLRRDPVSLEVDLAYRFFPENWSRGIATEAALCALDAGFKTFELPEIIGLAMRENLPSITILQKLGMRFRELREENDLIWLIYAIKRDAFKPPG